MKTFLLFLFATAAFAQAQYDLLLKGGHVIDPRNNIDALRDVAIKDRKIAAVAENIDPALAAKVLDVKGLYVTPGLLDIHVHLFTTPNVPDAWTGNNSIRPDDFSFRTGVTTMVDAGSSGYRNFEVFRVNVIDRAKTRVFALINIAGQGMTPMNMAEQVPADMKPAEVVRLAKKHSDVVVGIKAAHYQGPEWVSVDRALEAGRMANLPIMVDFGFFKKERPYYELVTKRLRPGDISTHSWIGPAPWVDENGMLYPYVYEARKRGVLFDVGHGQGSFIWRNVAAAVAQGFYPDSISTDLHALSMNAAMMDMQTVMSKFLVAGMPLKDVIHRSTWNPAQIIHHPELGHLTPGVVADVAAFRVMEGDFAYGDSAGGRFHGKQRLLCELTIRNGDVAWDWNARSYTDYQKLDPEYGVRPGEFLVRPPKK
jgi:dihydroorotase